MTRLYSRVSDRNFICLKSIAHCRGDPEEIISTLSNFQLKVKFDDTLESAHVIYGDLPYDTLVAY